MPLHIDFPWHFDPSGGTAATPWADHLRDLLVQFLFTSPGERVNRPDFGAGLYGLCFENNSRELTDVLQFVVQAGLQRWFGDDLEVVRLEVRGDEAALIVGLAYRLGDEEGERQIEVTREGVR